MRTELGSGVACLAMELCELCVFCGGGLGWVLSVKKIAARSKISANM